MTLFENAFFLPPNNFKVTKEQEGRELFALYSCTLYGWHTMRRHALLLQLS